VENVTPQDAKALLELNTENYRRVRPGLVNKYARDMAAGRWRFTGDTLKIDRNGIMADGQNRLSAQIKADVTLPWTIVWGTDPEATMVMDSGGARTAADHLTHVGVPNAHQAAAIARQIIRETMPARGNTGVSTAEVDELIKADKSIVAIASAVSGLNSILKLATKRTIGFVWWRLAKVDPIKAEEFIRRLDRLDNLDKRSPILALHRRLLAIKTERGAASPMASREMTATMIYAWNAWIKGETRELLKTVTRPDGSMHMPEPIKPRPEVDPPAIVEQNQLPADRRRNGAA
jgi:hypothetical protein